MKGGHTTLSGCCTAGMLYSVYAVLGICYNRHRLYLVYTELGVCCTWCLLYLVYAVLGVCCTHYMLSLVYALHRLSCTRCQLMLIAWRDREGGVNFAFCDDGWVMDEKERDGKWRWECSGGYMRIWEIWSMTCLIAFARPRISVVTSWVGPCRCRIGDGKLTRTQNSLKSQFHTTISPIFCHLSLSHLQLYHHLRTRSYVIPVYLSIQYSIVTTEYRTHPAQAYTQCSIHPIQHRPSTAYTEQYIPRSLQYPKVDCLLLAANLSSLCRPCCIQFSTFPHLQVNQWMESQLPSRFPPELLLPDWLPLSFPGISRDHGFQVHLQTRLITSSKIAWLWPPTASPNSIDYGV